MATASEQTLFCLLTKKSTYSESQIHQKCDFHIYTNERHQPVMENIDKQTVEIVIAEQSITVSPGDEIAVSLQSEGLRVIIGPVDRSHLQVPQKGRCLQRVLPFYLMKNNQSENNFIVAMKVQVGEKCLLQCSFLLDWTEHIDQQTQSTFVNVNGKNAIGSQNNIVRRNETWPRFTKRDHFDFRDASPASPSSKDSSEFENCDICSDEGLTLDFNNKRRKKSIIS